MSGVSAPELRLWAVPGIPEIGPGDDLAAQLGDALEADAAQHPDHALADGDVLAVTSKIVSKAEGRQVIAASREQAITDQTVRVVATRHHERGVTRIVENRLGLVMAAAGVDGSNAPDGTVLLLPEDPDRSARQLRQALTTRFGVTIGLIITDTAGRPWRNGLTDFTVGAAGLQVLEDLRGTTDTAGHRLEMTITAVADQLAAAAELVKGKANGLPLAVIRGAGRWVTEEDGPGATALIRPAAEDMFRLGTAEAFAAGYQTAGEGRPGESGPE
ncbi:MAG: coenzyme F420-0:L-glutamate ligase [Bifidobacteriaceae bacterium]|nr:coenzyme F420-0:L-glutamate ligase [Bifidobacteriaceae bacterium]